MGWQEDDCAGYGQFAIDEIVTAVSLYRCGYFRLGDEHAWIAHARAKFAAGYAILYMSQNAWG